MQRYDPVPRDHGQSSMKESMNIGVHCAGSPSPLMRPKSSLGKGEEMWLTGGLIKGGQVDVQQRENLSQQRAVYKWTTLAEKEQR